MIKKYFNVINKKILKKGTQKKADSEKKDKSSRSTPQAIDVKILEETIRGLIPGRLNISSLKPVDSSGFSPDGADFIIYNEYCRDIDKLFSGQVPYELVHGAVFTVHDLTKSTLADAINRVSSIKKINQFAETESVFSIPSFIIAGCGTSYPLPDIKNDVINYYISRGVEAEAEFELLAVLNYGILIKDWHRGNRSYVALETGEDTLMWLAILMCEYLDIEREDEFDLRRYVRSDRNYNEF